MVKFYCQDGEKPLGNKLNLKKRFGISELTGKQHLVVDVLLAKKDCLVVVPTGEGKSLCFQLPAIIDSDVTISTENLNGTVEETDISEP
ncbi:hypothetical protein DAPPUDRAFT_258881 [Daphnia pulex]|uniref:DEAD/DEAH-box helicase domain-containing protein n=1 Tax=Daphnia pulex TaxID=6669 RepID=E9HG72_DAPPU|nr:hypothetical protein DAPPUDRAFT_258881 [Daphnia pulex]|eukprot:EFX69263.1 hypothetical protein DAPPUDRAFT_258881 [Daphnia pulex]